MKLSANSPHGGNPALLIPSFLFFIKAAHVYHFQLAVHKKADFAPSPHSQKSFVIALFWTDIKATQPFGNKQKRQKSSEYAAAFTQLSPVANAT